ncbi:hypothetical protein ACJ9E6_004079 [Providencia rettgeri]
MKSNTPIDWETQPTVLVNPLKKKKLEQHIFLIGIGICLCIGFYLWMDQSGTKAIALYENDIIKSEMTIKANEGKVAAQLWMAEHYPDEHIANELDTLIEQGNAEAMIIKAQRVYPSDEVLAISLINQAAQEGHPDAIRYLSDKKTDDITFTEFFKYMFKGELNE